MNRLLLFFSFAIAAIAQQNAVLLPWTPQQFTNTNGTILVSGKVCTYLAGTSTGTATFTDATASVQNAIPPNAVLLDSTARPTSGGIWLTPGKAYKIVTMTAGSDGTCNTGVVVKTQDNVVAVGNTYSVLNGCQYVNSVQTFAQALAAVSNPGCIEITPGTYPVSVNSTIPSGVILRSNSGGLLSIATAVTLTVNGQIIAPAQQIFSYTGTGTAVVAQGNVEALWFPGANLGVQVNNAALALNSAKAGNNTHAAGKIHIAAGTYSVPLGVMNPQADVLISCDENQAAAITFTGASGIALLFNVGTATGTYYEFGQGIENCQLYGPGWPTGSGQVGTGIQIGDSTHATLGVRLHNNFIAGFTLGLTWGTDFSSWGAKIDHTTFLLNTQSLVYNPNNAGGTENIELDHVVFAPSFTTVIANDVVIGPGTTITDMWLNNCSFDNSQLVISNGSSVGLTKPHFEFGFNTTQPFVSMSGGAFVSIYSPFVQYDPTMGSVPPEVFLVSGGAVFDLYSASMQSNAATITNYLNATNSITRVWGIMKQNANIGAATYSAGWHTECPTGAVAGGACAFSLGNANFSVTTSNIINLIASSLLNFQGPVGIVEGGLNPQPGYLAIGESSSTHAIQANPNNTVTGQLDFVQCNTSQKTETAADTNLLTCAIPAVAGSYRIRFVMSISAANNATLGWTATWTDSNGTANAPTNLAEFNTGVAAPGLTLGPFNGVGAIHGYVDVDVNNSATSIVVKTTFAGTSFTAKASATVERII